MYTLHPIMFFIGFLAYFQYWDLFLEVQENIVSKFVYYSSVMSMFLFVVSAICFIAAFGAHMYGRNNDYCGYMDVPWMSAIPWISGFILAVIPESFIFNISWWWLFLINIPTVFIFGPLFTQIILRRISSGKGAGVDVLVSMSIAIVTLIIGVLTR